MNWKHNTKEYVISGSDYNNLSYLKKLEYSPVFADATHYCSKLADDDLLLVEIGMLVEDLLKHSN